MTNDDFVITRILNAPRLLVWDAHTREEHLKHWWGPKGCEVTLCNMDLRVGGMFHYGLKMGELHIYGKWVFREITAPGKLVMISGFADEQGNFTRNPWDANWPLEILSTFTFEDQPGGKTRLTVTWAPHDAPEISRKVFQEGKDSMQQGWSGTLERLETYLPKAK